MNNLNQALKAAQILKLYRNILNAHRFKVDKEMRQFGDIFVKEEFRQHVYGDKTTEKHIDNFLKEWEGYHSQLLAMKDIQEIGRHISEEDGKFFTSEQIESIQTLKVGLQDSEVDLAKLSKQQQDKISTASIQQSFKKE